MNLDLCDLSDITFRVYLYDVEYFEEVLFEFNESISDSSENNKWNEYDECFVVLGRKYQLFIEFVSTCKEAGNRVFIAVDDFLIKEKTDSNDLEEKCKNIRITERPPTTTIESTTQEITDSTLLFTTDISDPDTPDTTQPNIVPGFFIIHLLLVLN